MKVLITIIGGASTGKSTLGRALLAGALEDRFGGVAGPWLARNFKTGWGIVGNVNSGTDVISATADRHEVTNYLLDDKGIHYIVVNSVRSSGPVDVDWPRANPRKFACLYVYLDLSEEECLRRPAARRAGNGKTGPLTETNIRNAKAFLRRAQNVCKYLERVATDKQSHYSDEVFGRPIDIVDLTDKDTVENSLKKVQRAAKRLSEATW